MAFFLSIFRKENRPDSFYEPPDQLTSVTKRKFHGKNFFFCFFLFGPYFLSKFFRFLGSRILQRGFYGCRRYGVGFEVRRCFATDLTYQSLLRNLRTDGDEHESDRSQSR